MSGDTRLARLASRIRSDTRITVLTGAGVSAASGVPTFRGHGGLWRQYRPEQLATPQAFARNPELVWEWYAWRRQQIASCRPNRAHEVIAAWSLRYPDFHLITQNVDGLHERAGTLNVTRFHGSIWELSCWQACQGRTWTDQAVPLPSLPPRCPSCGGLARPAVTWFGEPITPEVLNAAGASLRCDVFLMIGTSALVYPAAALGRGARQQGAFAVEINLEPTPQSDAVDLAFHERAETILDRLEQMLQA